MSSTPKQVLQAWLQENPIPNLSIVDSLVANIVEADVIEESLNVVATRATQALTPAAGKVWTAVNVAAAVLEPDAPKFATFEVKDVAGTAEIDEEAFTVKFTPDTAIADKSALVLTFTRETAPVITKYPVKAQSALNGETAITSGTTTLDFSSVATKTLTLKTTYQDLESNPTATLVRSQAWTVEILDPAA